MIKFDFSINDIFYLVLIILISIIVLKILINELIKYGIKGFWFAIKKLFKLSLWLLFLPFWIIKKINCSNKKNNEEKWWS